MNNPQRRAFLTQSLVCSAIAIAATSGLLRPTRVFAAKWPIRAFEASSVRGALTQLYGGAEFSSDKRVRIKAPVLAEDGRRVPIEIDTDFRHVESIALLIEGNKFPLASRAYPKGMAVGYFSARIKMAKSSDVVAIVKANGKLYGARHKIEVVVGGCAG